jgi:hypothetical protein
MRREKKSIDVKRTFKHVELKLKLKLKLMLAQTFLLGMAINCPTHDQKS